MLTITIQSNFCVHQPCYWDHHIPPEPSILARQLSRWCVFKCGTKVVFICSPCFYLMTFNYLFCPFRLPLHVDFLAIKFHIKAWSNECRMVPHRPTHKKRMLFNDLETNDVDKGENNTHKQRTLPNDERLVKGSNVHETNINGCQKMSLAAHNVASFLRLQKSVNS